MSDRKRFQISTEERRKKKKLFFLVFFSMETSNRQYQTPSVHVGATTPFTYTSGAGNTPYRSRPFISMGHISPFLLLFFFFPTVLLDAVDETEDVMDGCRDIIG